jgi:protein-tyrosine phosphatase
VDYLKRRRLLWEGCINVRDLGGLPTCDGGETAWRRLVRADSLCSLTPAGCAALVDYGVRTVIDLRSAGELAWSKHPFADSSGVGDGPRYLSLPMLDEEDPGAMAALEAAPSRRALNVVMLECFAARIAAVLRAMVQAEPGGVLFHCMGGKDRTGVIAALILSLAEVPAEAIAADYGASEVLNAAMLAQMLARTVSSAEQESLKQRFSSPPGEMLGTLAYLDIRWGGVAAYLRAIGLSDAELACLRGRART